MGYLRFVGLRPVRGTWSYGLVVLALLTSATHGCGPLERQPEAVSSASADQQAAPDLFVALEAPAATEGTVWLSSGESLAAPKLCQGVAADCSAGKGTYLALVPAGSRNGRTFYRSEQSVPLRHRAAMAVVTVRPGSQDYLVVRAFQFLDPTQPQLQPGQAGDLDLAFGEVFDQKNTNWCWAYASYHTLRTYYYNLPENGDANASAWRAALKEFDSDDKFRALMKKHRSPSTAGNPHQFISIIREEKGLPEGPNWDYAEDDRSQTIALVEENLRKGVPTAYCRSGHCVMIYGFTSNGTAATKFRIADSSPARKYDEDASRVKGRYSGIWTIMPSSYSEDGRAARERYYDEHPLTAEVE